MMKTMMIKQSNTIMEQNQEEKQEYIVLPREYMIEGIVNATKEMHRMLQETRAEVGKLYNEMNEYEQCMRRFDVDDPEKVLAEYEKIFEKRSTLPSVIRGVLQQLGDNARNFATQKFLAPVAKEKEEKEK